MSHIEERHVYEDVNLLVVRARIAEEHARARAENLAHGAQAADAAPRQPGAARAWLGRRLVAMGTVLGADPPVAEHSSTTGQPC